MKHVDFLIVGQGLAGSTLAYELLKRGKEIMVLDRGDRGSSSRVAAGLITPLTGKGMNPAWRQNEYLPKAAEHYREIEGLSGKDFYHSHDTVRLFRSEKEKLKWLSKDAEHEIWAQYSDEDDFGIGHGSLIMPQGAWLNTPVYLKSVKEILQQNDAFRDADFHEDQVEHREDGILWEDVYAAKIIICLGAYGLGESLENNNRHTWFADVPHRSAKGEILSLKVKGLNQDKRYHAAGWMAPRGNDIWRAGASYDWNNLNSEPTSEGRQKVMDQLKKWLPNDLQIEVTAHEAGVRPIIRNSRPVVLIHPTMRNVSCFNGLGSKGVLMAPAVARSFASYLCGEAELDKELIVYTKNESLKILNVIKREKISGSLLYYAHELIETHIDSGDTVVDATMGNGHDTLFLARCVGQSGFVIAFDIQREALTNTRNRLAEGSIDHSAYQLYKESHTEIRQRVDCGTAAAVIFNLGYLPSGDKKIITCTSSTMIALNAALASLKDRGLLSVMCYPGHAGGDEEAAEVKSWFVALHEQGLAEVSLIERESGRETTPFLLIAKKRSVSD
ncbi:MAG: FAD-dependent oxidoreductase [Akkermansiaceae bacterium]